MSNSSANNFFQLMMGGKFAQIQAEREIEKILGLKWDTLAGIGFDYYDTSFEIYAPEEADDIVPTEQQHQQILGLGCSRYWINFKDGTERYCRGERKASSSNRWQSFDNGDKLERRGLLVLSDGEFTDRVILDIFNRTSGSAHTRLIPAVKLFAVELLKQAQLLVKEKDFVNKGT